uniref:Ycf55 n=1 Tax=Gracilaria firma TaxID=2510791 RepID=A0A2Z2JJ06_9FLOR|nr:Ycf55 [Gracilaria changii]ART65340.1 Ycf55 [Gracilaria changii]
MVNYWPHNQGIYLNHEVAYLFAHIKQKFSKNLSNNTKDYLYIDILSNSVKHKLFSIVLVELEILVLDLVELNVSLQSIQILKEKIFYDLIQKVIAHFLIEYGIDNGSIILVQSKRYNYLQVTLLEYKWLLENLLTYLIFGSMYIKNYIFAFDTKYTPIKHVEILLEHIMVQISNLAVFMILENLKSLSNIITFLTKHKLSNACYISIRSLASFRNNLFYQSLLYLYIIRPKYIYSNRYKVCLISRKGLIARYIYAYRLEEFIRLSYLQLIIITLIELQDFIMPKFEKFLLILVKLILYIFINILGNGIMFFIRIIILAMDSLQR